MGMTMSQKILAAHAGLEEVKAGQLIEADLDLVHTVRRPSVRKALRGKRGSRVPPASCRR